MSTATHLSPETCNLNLHKEPTLLSKTVSPKTALAFQQPTEDEYTAVSEIHNAQNEPDLHYSPEQLQQMDAQTASRDASAKRYVAVLDGEVIATGYLRHSWWGHTYPGRYWTGIYVRTDYRNQGIDTQMLHRALKDLEPPAKEVWTVVREDFLEPAGFLRDEGFTEQGRTWGAHLDLTTFDVSTFAEVRERLGAEGFSFLPYHTLQDPEKHTKVQALHAEAKRDMPLFEPVATAEFDDVEDEATLPETVMVAVKDGELVGVSSVDRGNRMLHFGLTAVTAPYRYRGVGRVLKALSADATKQLGHTHINSGGAGTDTPILQVNRALGFNVEPAWLSLASRR